MNNSMVTSLLSLAGAKLSQLATQVRAIRNTGVDDVVDLCDLALSIVDQIEVVTENALQEAIALHLRDGAGHSTTNAATHNGAAHDHLALLERFERMGALFASIEDVVVQNDDGGKRAATLAALGQTVAGTWASEAAISLQAHIGGVAP